MHWIHPHRWEAMYSKTPSKCFSQDSQRALHPDSDSRVRGEFSVLFPERQLFFGTFLATFLGITEHCPGCDLARHSGESRNP